MTSLPVILVKTKQNKIIIKKQFQLDLTNKEGLFNNERMLVRWYIQTLLSSQNRLRQTSIPLPFPIDPLPYRPLPFPYMASFILFPDIKTRSDHNKVLFVIRRARPCARSQADLSFVPRWRVHLWPVRR